MELVKTILSVVYLANIYKKIRLLFGKFNDGIKTKIVKAETDMCK